MFERERHCIASGGGERGPLPFLELLLSRAHTILRQKSEKKLSLAKAKGYLFLSPPGRALEVVRYLRLFRRRLGIPCGGEKGKTSACVAWKSFFETSFLKMIRTSSRLHGENKSSS